MSVPRRATAALHKVLFAVVAAIPGAAAGQSCGLVAGTGFTAAAGYAAYDVARGVSGVAYGLDGNVAVPVASVRVGYRRVGLDGRSADLGRVAAAFPLPLPLALGPVDLCGIGHAGAARLPVDDDATTVLAGGAGVRVSATLDFGGGSAVPYGEARGLAARSTGTLFGVELDGSGLALGVEAGVQATIGRMIVSVAASLDGFDDGLGVTPYPNTAAEIGVGIRF